MGRSDSLPRSWHTSPLWWLCVPLSTLAMLLPAPWTVGGQKLIQITALLHHVALLLLPARHSVSRLAFGWRIIAFAWSGIALRQIMSLISYSLTGETHYAWMEILLLGIYIPPIVLAIRLFYQLPFQRRSRASLIWDCIALFYALIIGWWKIAQFPLADILFISGNSTMVFAIVLIYQQERDSWKRPFRAITGGMIALIISDIVWAICRRYGIDLQYTVPVYLVAWELFARSALVLPITDIRYDEEVLFTTSWLQDTLGTIALMIAAIVLLMLKESPIWVLVAVVLMTILRLVEHQEQQQLQQRLERARIHEGTLRYVLEGLAHDIKVPLAMIGAAIQQGGTPNAAGRTGWGNLREHHATLQRRIGTLLDVARGQQDLLQCHPVDLATVEQDVRDVITCMAPMYDFAGVVQVENAAPAARVAIDIEAMRRIFENIISNALKVHQHTSDPTITVLLQATPSAVTITIADNGPGFGRIQFAESTKLGLSSVELLMEQMGGAVDYPEQALGGRIVLSLPRVR